MTLKKLHKKHIDTLKNELLNLLQKYFSLRIKLSNRQLTQTHLLKKIRKNIAQVKTLLNKKEKS